MAVDELSPLGWATLVCFSIFFIGLNLTLLVAFRNRGARIDTRPPRSLNPFSRDPWAQENADWRKLSEQVEQLKKQDLEGDDPSSGDDLPLIEP